MKKIFTILLFLSLTSSVYSGAAHAPANVPRISAEVVKLFISRGVKYIFIDSSTFGDSHVCGAIFISYTWIPPYGKNKIKKINIPKDYYIFCY